MKTIVDITEENHKYITAYASQEKKDISEIINNCIEESIVKPTKKLDDALKNSRDLEHFKSVFSKYMHEDLESMYSLIDSSEEVKEDRKMLEVYKHIYFKILFKDINFLEIYEVYCKASEDKL